MKRALILSMALFLTAWLGAVGQSTYGDSASRNGLVIPAGTDISVRTNEAIDSTTATNRSNFTADVTDDVKGPSGEVLIPRGSPAELTVQKTSSGGTTGSSELSLALHSVSVNGRRYLVNSAEVTQSGKQGIGKNKRTAEMVGGGALLGTLVGAIAGGGKGAAIGAVAGAAAGGTAQVLTRGKEVKVPAETVLHFKLDQPLTLQEGSY